MANDTLGLTGKLAPYFTSTLYVDEPDLNTEFVLHRKSFDTVGLLRGLEQQLPTFSSQNSNAEGSNAAASAAPQVSGKPAAPFNLPAPASGAPSSMAPPAPAPPKVVGNGAVPPQPLEAADEHLARGGYAPRIPRRLTPMYYKIMVVGESGLGKTTFVKNLFEPYFAEGFKAAADGSSTPLDLFEDDPDQLCTELPGLPLQEASRMLQIKVQDTPGYGDDMNISKHLHLIVQHILTQRAKDYEHFSGNPRVGVEGALPHSVSICLYFLPPHRMKTVDLIFLATLSKLVAVVPIIAKADSMTAPELARYKSEIEATLRNPSLIFKQNVDKVPIQVPIFRFSNSDMECLEVPSDRRSPVFAAIASEDVDRSNGQYKPYRKYGWGTCYAMDREHADSILLKRLLMGDRTESIWDILDDSMARYREFCRKYSSIGENLAAAVDEGCRVCEEHLSLEENVQERKRLKAAESELHMLQAEHIKKERSLEQALSQIKMLEDKLEHAYNKVAALQAVQVLQSEEAEKKQRKQGRN